MSTQDRMQTFEDRLTTAVVDELTPVDMEARFDAMLDDRYSFESIGGIFACMQPSRVLRKCDPIAHRCGVTDMMDYESERVVEIAGDLYDIDEVEDIRQRLEAEDDAEVV